MAKNKIQPEWDDLELKVLVWARDRNLLKHDNATKQMVKVTEEVGELAREVLKANTPPNNRPELSDAFGDVLVTIIILAAQLQVDPLTCLEQAYNEISGRTGSTVNGIFVKDK